MKNSINRPLAGESFGKRVGMFIGAPLCAIGALLAVILISLPAAALAEEGGELEGSVTLGAQTFNIDHKSAHFGKYTGVDDKGTFLVGELELGFSKALLYAEVEGKNLGLDNRDVKIQIGSLGGCELKLRFSQSPNLISSAAKTIYNGVGSNTLTLPVGFKPGLTTKDMAAQLAAAAKDIKLKVNRTAVSAEFGIPFGGFLVDVRYSSDKRKGETPVFGSLGISGGNNKAVDLPAPVDYTTNDMTIALHYKGDGWFAMVDFSANTFDNANQSVTWDNPFPTTVSAVNYPTKGKTSLPPSNTYQRFGLAGGVKDLPMNSALSLNFDSATSKQDQKLFDYSINPNSTVAIPMPRSSAGARIDVTDYSIKLNSKPVDNLGVKLEYSNYTTKNKTPSDLWIYIPLDSGVAQDGLNGSHALYNLPVDYAKTDMKADLAYTIAGSTTLRVGYLNEAVARAFREVAKTKEDKVSAGLDTKFGMGKLRVGYSSGKRKIDGNYDEAAVFDAYHTPQYIATITPPTLAFDDHPLMRKFDIAARDRTRTTASLMLWPSEMADVTLAYGATEDKYGESTFGLTSSKGQSMTADVTIRPAKDVSVFAFYSTDNIKSEQASRAYSGAALKEAQSQDATRNWTATHDDKTPTLGGGVVFTTLDEKLDIGAYYSASDATTAISFATGGGLTTPTTGPIKNMPDLKTKLTSIDVTAKYRVSAALTIGLGYAYETFETKSWALNGVDPASKAIFDVITMVPIEPDYKASKAMVFAVWSLGK
jgi:MtrB/PioB family decaheme-associated outer membrane protein